jgi:hypothetical protein
MYFELMADVLARCTCNEPSSLIAGSLDQGANLNPVSGCIVMKTFTQFIKSGWSRQISLLARAESDGTTGERQAGRSDTVRVGTPVDYGLFDSGTAQGRIDASVAKWSLEPPMTVLILAIGWWSAIEVTLELGTGSYDTVQFVVVAARLILIAAGLAAIVHVPFARAIFLFLCATSILAVAPDLPWMFKRSVAVSLISLVDCAGKVTFVILSCVEFIHDKPSGALPTEAVSGVKTPPVETGRDIETTRKSDGIAAGRCNMTAIPDVLRTWIVLGSNAYDEYTYVPSLNKNVYRRTVNLNRVCIQ